ncbi:MAG: universal stress protein [Chloroflexota bacterium]|nr:universal stress protein [Chloroflexota bacterium]
MYNKLMVPLDGSLLAEKALPYAITLANRFGAELLLMRVSEVPALVSDTPEHELEVIHAAEIYLAEVQKFITAPTLNPHLEAKQVQTLVAYGESVREIAEIAPFEKVDLILMTTHGRTGLSRLVLGSVATSIIQHSKLPVILIRPEKLEEMETLTKTLTTPTSFSPDENGRRVLVTLDGSPEAESVLVPALEMAHKLEAALYLIRVVAPFVPIEYGDMGVSYAFDVDQETENRRETAYQYLDKIQARIAENGLNCVKVVRIGNPADEIVDYARKIQASMLVIATHARGKLGHLFMGSVAEEVTRRTNLPVMMVHILPHGKSETSDKPAASMVS